VFRRSHEAQPATVKGEMESDESQESRAEHFDGRPAERQERKSIPGEPANATDAVFASSLVENAKEP